MFHCLFEVASIQINNKRMVVFATRTNHEKEKLKMDGKNSVYLEITKWHVICQLAIWPNFWIPKGRELWRIVILLRGRACILQPRDYCNIMEVQVPKEDGEAAKALTKQGNSLFVYVIQ